MGVSPSAAINDSLKLSRWNAALRGVTVYLNLIFFLARILDVFIKKVNLAGQL